MLTVIDCLSLERAQLDMYSELTWLYYFSIGLIFCVIIALYSKIPNSVLNRSVKEDIYQSYDPIFGMNKQLDSQPFPVCTQLSLGTRLILIVLILIFIIYPVGMIL